MASLPNAQRHAYRLVSPKYPPFDGSGARRWGSRWISPGRWVVHAAESYALAILENLVHWQTTTLPPKLVCVKVEIPDELEQEEVDAPDICGRPQIDYLETRAIGDDWYDRGETAVLWVPSVVSPYESNLLFNQEHPDFVRLVVHESTPAHVDPRLWPSTVNTG